MDPENESTKDLEDLEKRLMADLDADPSDPADADLPDGDEQAGSDEPSKPAAAASTEKIEDKAEPAKDDKKSEDAGLDAKARAQVRAARRAERHARMRADALERELQQLRAQGGQATQEGPDDDEVLAVLETDLPEAAKRFKALKSKVQELEQTKPSASQQQQAEFVPESLPAEIQDDVDEVDELADWQHDPDQARWQMAKRIDMVLEAHPKWAGKPRVERFREVARRVNQELGEPPVQKPKPGAAPRVDDDVPETLTGVRGGASTRNTEPDYSRMTDEQILNSL